MAASERALACPCADAHRRLQDVHEEIHRAVEGYLDDNDFRRALNNAIQASRSVSWLIQKRKAKWQDFDSWYSDWQGKARDNKVMRWGLNARNRIVKEEDLVRLSQASVSVYGERLQEVELTLQVDPSTTTQGILERLDEVVPGVSTRNSGWVEIQRKWIDEQLPDFELVDALKELYRNGSILIQRAHQASRVSRCLESGSARPCITNALDPQLDCLDEQNATTVGVLDLKSKKVTSVVHGRVKIDLKRIEQLSKRYDFIANVSTDAIVHAHERLELSKMFLEADGYSSPVIAFLKDGEPPRISPASFTKAESREMKIAQLARLHGAWPYEGVVHSGETWVSMYSKKDEIEWFADILPSDLLPQTEKSVYDADPIGNRQEALFVTALKASGECLALWLPFVRTKQGVRYGPLIESTERSDVVAFLRPVWKNWPKWNVDLSNS